MQIKALYAKFPQFNSMSGRAEDLIRTKASQESFTELN